jgi:hypothetical protein
MLFGVVGFSVTYWLARTKQYGNSVDLIQNENINRIVLMLTCFQ